MSRPPLIVSREGSALIKRLVDCRHTLHGGDRIFADSLVAGFDKYGRFTDRQAFHVEKLVTRAEKAIDAASAVAVPETPDPGPGELLSLVELLSSVKSDRAPTLSDNIPTLRAMTFQTRVTLSPDRSGVLDAGTIVVRNSSRVPVGIITPTGHWSPVVNGFTDKYRNHVLDGLRALAKDPYKQARQYGRYTGECACCGRELTNTESVKLGIGPVCAARYGWS